MGFAVLILSIWLMSSPPALAANDDRPCHVSGIDTYVRCGSLRVPLDYQQPAGDAIDIGFVVLPGYNASSSQRPLFFLAGGPGQAATGLAAQVNNMFSAVRADRDIVLIDQRGTGRSSALDCDLPAESTLAAREDLIDTELLAQCIAQLPDGIEHFTTANAVRDFEAVRQHLGYSMIDLYGGSYGSRAAFAYLALAGEAVHAVILDGVAPPEVPIGLFGRSAAAAFEQAISHCYANSQCADAYPELREQFSALRDRLEAQPIVADIPHPVTGQVTTLRLWQGQFISVLRVLLYSPTSVALLPAIIEAAARGDYKPIAALMASANQSMDVNLLLHLTIVCNEDVPRFDEAATSADADNDFGGATSHRLLAKACALMPRFDAELAWMSAGPFTQPTLLLSGGADPVTPPANGDIATALFTRQRHVTAPEHAHIVASSECGSSLIAAFLTLPVPDDLDTTCIANMPGQRFVLSPMGTISVSATRETP